MYETRKAFLLAKLTRECEVLDAKARFIKLVIEGELVIRRRKIVDLVKELAQRGFKPLADIKEKETSEGKDDAGEDEKDEDENDGAEEGEEKDVDDADAGVSAGSEKSAVSKGVKDFEYLVGMPISTLTAEKIAELMKLHKTKTAELDAIRKKPPTQVWLDDLDELEKALDERDAAISRADQLEQMKIAKARSKQGKAPDRDGKRGAKRGASVPADAGGRGQKRGK